MRSPAIHTFKGRPPVNVQRAVEAILNIQETRRKPTLQGLRDETAYMWRNFRRARSDGAAPATLAIWRTNFYRAFKAWRQFKAASGGRRTDVPRAVPRNPAVLRHYAYDARTPHQEEEYEGQAVEVERVLALIAAGDLMVSTDLRAGESYVIFPMPPHRMAAE